VSEEEEEEVSLKTRKVKAMEQVISLAEDMKNKSVVEWSKILASHIKVKFKADGSEDAGPEAARPEAEGSTQNLGMFVVTP